MKILGFKGEFEVLISQIVTLKKGKKLSKRKGEIITLKELIDEVGLDVARFFYLQKALDTHMEFDLDLAKEQSEKNPVYYIQYAHARICSILRRCKMRNKIKNPNTKLLTHPSEIKLIKTLIKFPEIIESCARDYQVHRLTQYALETASAFHRFYKDCRVLIDDKNLQEARLSLVLATQIVLRNLLSLMGISVPKKM